MVKVIRIFVVMALLMAVATPALAKGPNRQVPIKGTVVGEHERFMFVGDCGPEEPGPEDEWWTFTSEGVGHMSHLGKVDYYLTQCTTPGPDGFASVGTITFTAANGDELLLEHTMLSELVFGPAPGPPLGFAIEGAWTAVGGTGRFTNSSGSGELYGAGNLYGILDPDVPPGLLGINFEGKIAYKRK